MLHGRGQGYIRSHRRRSVQFSCPWHTAAVVVVAAAVVVVVVAALLLPPLPVVGVVVVASVFHHTLNLLLPSQSLDQGQYPKSELELDVLIASHHCAREYHEWQGDLNALSVTKSNGLALVRRHSRVQVVEWIV